MFQEEVAESTFADFRERERLESAASMIRSAFSSPYANMRSTFVCRFSRTMLIMLTIVEVIVISAIPAMAQDIPRVVILNSYHPGFSWSDDEVSGLCERLKEVYPAIDVPIEYLDAKRHSESENLLRVKDFLVKKYQGARVDLLVVLDNPALEMLGDYATELFPDIPIVFAGISNVRQSLPAGRKRLTGVAEMQDVNGTLELALSLHPETKEVLILNDYTTSGLSAGKEVQTLVSSFAGRVRIRFLPPVTFEKARAEIGSLSQNSVVVINSYSTDRIGHSLSHEESTRTFTSASQVPVYGVHLTRLGQGIVGGYLLDGREHGRRAGDIALRVLAGEDPDRIPVDFRNTAKPMFDHNQLARFGISSAALPAGSLVVNKPYSFVESHWKLVIGTLAIMGLLAGMVLLLTVFNIRGKRTEEALRQSEFLFKSLYDLGNIGIAVTSVAKGWLKVNPKLCVILGYTEEELQQTTWKEVTFPDDLAADEKQFNRMLAGEIAGYEMDKRFIRKDGSLIYAHLAVSCYRDSAGVVRFVIASVQDITERKRLEESLHQAQFSLDTSRDMVHWVTPDARLVYVNDAFCKALGYSREDLLTMTVFDIDPCFDRESWPEHWEKTRSFGSFTLETKYRTKDARVIPVEIVIDFMAFHGKEFHSAVARDITERKQAEEELREKEERLRFALEGTNDGIWNWNVQTGQAYFSRRWFTMLGYEPYEFPSTYESWCQLLHPDDVDETEKSMAIAVENRSRFAVEYRLKAKNGEWCWILGRGKVVELDSQGNSLRVAGSNSDITDRKKAEKELKEAKEFAEAVLDSLPGIFFVYDSTPALVRWNKNHESMLGYSSEELLGRHPTDFFEGSDKERIALAAQEVMLKGTASVEADILTKSGADIPMHFVGISRTIGGREHFLGVALDISALKKAEADLRKSEELFRTIFRTAPDAVSISTLDRGIFVDVNEIFLEIMGYTREDLIGKSAINLNIWENIRERDEIVKRLAGEGFVHNVECSFVRKDGRVKQGLCSAGTIMLDGEAHLLMLLKDITELKKAEQERQNLERQVQHAQKLESLGVLAGGIAHDFNNILTSVLGNTDLALMRISPIAPARAYLDEIKKGTLRAAGLANQMLAYSGKGKFQLKSIDLSMLVKEMAQLLEVSISKKVALTYNLAENLPLIEGDVNQIQQVVMNLITNASESIGGENGIIRLTTAAMFCDRMYLHSISDEMTSSYREPLSEGLYVWLEVTDSGSGMDAETRRKVFDPFFTTKFTGRGLGMAAVLGIVRGHNGAIKIYSEPGKGSTFRVFFPVKEGEGTSQICETQGVQAEQWWKSGTVLVADDEEIVCMVAKEMLEEMGLRVMIAADGFEAVAKFRENSEKISCVLLDLTMPRLDGAQVFEEIRLIRPDAKVILSSGYNEQDVIQGLAERGLAGFIQKPYTLDMLREKLKEVIGIR